jgi:hypothetical protein
MSKLNLEYEELYPYEQEFRQWIEALEQQETHENARRAAILVQLGRDRWLFDQDDERHDFSPYNTCNS